jgi:methionyl-tRNA formyltransferase
MKPRTVFMGSPEFAIPTLRRLAQEYPVVGVVTQPDRPSGRGRNLTPPPVKTLALQIGIPVMQPEKLRLPEAMEQLRLWAPQLIVVAAFGQILRQEVLDLPEFGCINVHGSLLPRWRGAAPVQAAILNGDTETGISIMRMDRGVDTGPILKQRLMAILPEDTAGVLSERMAEMGAQFLGETLQDYVSGFLLPQTQPEAGVTYAPMLKKEDGLLDFSQPADQMARRVRAFNPWPGCYMLYRATVLKIHRGHATDKLFAQLWDTQTDEIATTLQETQGLAMTDRSNKDPLLPGIRLVHQGLPAISCGSGMLVLDEVQPAGKKVMPGKVFLQGAREWKS